MLCNLVSSQRSTICRRQCLSISCNTGCPQFGIVYMNIYAFQEVIHNLIAVSYRPGSISNKLPFTLKHFQISKDTYVHAISYAFCFFGVVSFINPSMDINPPSTIVKDKTNISNPFNLVKHQPDNRHIVDIDTINDAIELITSV
uniref:Uncharacterized protein n=1 Tax=Opuntia streptacantha TaxID=393608 RepID=A0A7C8ZZ10_OPUST